MTKVLAPSVFITKTYDTMRDFIETGKTPAITNDFILISKEKNRYLQSLEYSFNYSTKGISELVLRFIDVDGNLENTIFSQTFLEKLIGSTFTRYLDQVKSGQGSISDLNYVADNLTLSEFKIYVAFGVGDDLSNWSPPFICYLTKSNIDISNNIKSYVFTFVPDTGVFLRPSLEVDKNAVNYSEKFNFGVQNLKSEAEITIKIKGKEAVKDYLKQNLTDKLVSLLKIYLSKLTNIKSDNIIVLLPEITSDDFIRYIAYNYQKFKKDELGRVNPDVDGDEYDIASILGVIPLSVLINAYKSIMNIDCRVDDLKLQAWYADTFKRLRQARGSNGGMGYGIETRPPERDEEDIEYDVSLRIYSTSVTSKQARESNNTQIPNFWNPVNNIFEGLRAIYLGGQANLDLKCFVESNLRFLKFFKNKNLIKFDNEPCLIFGESQMISDYLYCNQSNLANIQSFLNYKSRFNILQSDPLYQILQSNSESYRSDLVKQLFPRKNNSAFSEKFNLDELALDPESQEKVKSLEYLSQFNSILTIPNFVHNFKNSNVLSFSLQNVEQSYLQSLRAAVVNQRASLLGNSGQFKDLLKSLGITEETVQKAIDSLEEKLKANGSTFRDFAEVESFNVDNVREIFSPEYEFEYAGWDLLSKSIGISPDDISYYEIYKSKKKIMDRKKFGISLEENYFDLSQEQRSKLDAADEDTLSKFIGVLGKFDRYNKNAVTIGGVEQGLTNIIPTYKVGSTSPVITSINLENNSLLAILFAEQLRDIPTGTTASNDKDYITLANLIIQNNVANLLGVNPSKTPSVQLTPTINGPKEGAILGKVTSEMLKQSFKLSIRTLPFFYLSDIYTIGRPAFFYSKRTSISTNKNNLNSDSVLDFYSGQYIIDAFKHVISANECHSEFTMIKTIDAIESSIANSSDKSGGLYPATGRVIGN